MEPSVGRQSVSRGGCRAAAELINRGHASDHPLRGDPPRDRRAPEGAAGCVRAPLSWRVGDPPARAHRLRRRAPVQERHHEEARRPRAQGALAIRADRHHLRGGDRDRSRRRRGRLRAGPGEAEARSGGGLPHRFRGRLRNPRRRRGGRPRRPGRSGMRQGAEDRHAQSLHRDPDQVAERRARGESAAHARHLPDESGQQAPARLLRHAAEDHRAGASVGVGCRLRGAGAEARAFQGRAQGRVHGRDHTVDPRSRRHLHAAEAPRCGPRAHDGGPLRDLRLHGVLRHHGGISGHAPPGLRLRQAHDEGRLRGHRHVSFGWSDHDHAGRAPQG